MRFSRSVLMLPLALRTALCARFITPPTDLTTVTGHAGIQVRYKEVPNGICELNSSVKSYSGYVDVAKDQHIYFYFFESRNNPSTDPLTMWFSGGPGSTSMSELFVNHGPCKIDSKFEPFNNPYSWTENSNMIFVDQPVEVGFSYTIPIPAYQDGIVNSSQTNIIGLPSNECPDYVDNDSCGTYGLQDITLTANSTQAGAENIWKTLQGFMGAFPQYSRNGFNLATESYGGHYGPVYTRYILEQNKKNIANATKIDFHTLIIGNGWYDPALQNMAYYNYSVSPGDPYDINVFADPSLAAKFYNNIFGPGNCIDQVKQCNELKRADVCNQADNFCTTNIDDVWTNTSNRNEVDIRELNGDPNYFYEYLLKEEVLQALGVFTVLSDYPLSTVQAFTTTGDDSLEVGSVEALRYILANNVSVMLYAGDADWQCNWIGGLLVAEELGLSSFAEAGFTNVTTPDGIVHAQVRQADLLSYVRVFEAGHEVPYYQPEVAQQMFDRAITRRDIATGKKKVGAGCGYRTKGPAFSDYREGNRTVQYQALPSNADYNITSNLPYVPDDDDIDQINSVEGGKGRRGSMWRKWARQIAVFLSGRWM